MQKIKFLLCHNYYQQAGGESLVFENQVHGLRSMGHEVVLYTRQNEELIQPGLARKAHTFLSAYSSRQTAAEIETIVRRERPDVAMVQNVFPLLSPSVYTTLARLQVPIVQAVYNYRFVCPQAELYTHGAVCERCIAGNFIHAARLRCYRGSFMESSWYASILAWHHFRGTFSQDITSFMVPDHFLGQRLARKLIPSEKVFRNPNPYFVTKEEIQLSHKGYILFVGRLTRQKGILTLLEAMCQVQSGLKLVIVGMGELFETVEGLIQAWSLTDKVSLLSARWGEAVIDLIRGSAAVIIPSEWYDNLPLILCQANAYGKPVIASRINGIPEYVEEGSNGFLFEPGSTAELANQVDALAELSPAAYSSLARSSRAYAEQVFDYPMHYRRLMEVLSALV